MLVSQKMTPMAPGADPMQTRMMMMMPVVFTFMFLNVSSGLNLYFLCSNIFQVGFQKVAERWMNDGKPASKEMTPRHLRANLSKTVAQFCEGLVRRVKLELTVTASESDGVVSINLLRSGPFGVAFKCCNVAE